MVAGFGDIVKGGFDAVGDAAGALLGASHEPEQSPAPVEAAPPPPPPPPAATATPPPPSVVYITPPAAPAAPPTVVITPSTVTAAPAVTITPPISDKGEEDNKKSEDAPAEAESESDESAAENSENSAESEDALPESELGGDVSEDAEDSVDSEEGSSDIEAAGDEFVPEDFEDTMDDSMKKRLTSDPPENTEEPTSDVSVTEDAEDSTQSTDVPMQEGLTSDSLGNTEDSNESIDATTETEPLSYSMENTEDPSGSTAELPESESTSDTSDTDGSSPMNADERTALSPDDRIQGESVESAMDSDSPSIDGTSDELPLLGKATANGGLGMDDPDQEQDPDTEVVDGDEPLRRRFAAAIPRLVSSTLMALGGVTSIATPEHAALIGSTPTTATAPSLLSIQPTSIGQETQNKNPLILSARSQPTAILDAVQAMAAPVTYTICVPGQACYGINGTLTTSISLPVTAAPYAPNLTKSATITADRLHLTNALAPRQASDPLSNPATAGASTMLNPNATSRLHHRRFQEPPVSILETLSPPGLLVPPITHNRVPTTLVTSPVNAQVSGSAAHFGPTPLVHSASGLPRTEPMDEPLMQTAATPGSLAGTGPSVVPSMGLAGQLGALSSGSLAGMGPTSIQSMGLRGQQGALPSGGLAGTSPSAFPSMGPAGYPGASNSGAGSQSAGSGSSGANKQNDSPVKIDVVLGPNDKELDYIKIGVPLRAGSDKPASPRAKDTGGSNAPSQSGNAQNPSGRGFNGQGFNGQSSSNQVSGNHVTSNQASSDESANNQIPSATSQNGAQSGLPSRITRRTPTPSRSGSSNPQSSESPNRLRSAIGSFRNRFRAQRTQEPPSNPAAARRPANPPPYNASSAERLRAQGTPPVYSGPPSYHTQDQNAASRTASSHQSSLRRQPVSGSGARTPAGHEHLGMHRVQGDASSTMEDFEPAAVLDPSGWQGQGAAGAGLGRGAQGGASSGGQGYGSSAQGGGFGAGRGRASQPGGYRRLSRRDVGLNRHHDDGDDEVLEGGAIGGTGLDERAKTAMTPFIRPVRHGRR